MSAKVLPDAEDDLPMGHRGSMGIMIEEPLLKIESGMTLYGEGITTIQFFKGNSQQAQAFLFERLGQVAALNPWIAGRLVRDTKEHGKLVALRYSEDTPLPEAVFRMNHTLQLREDMPYEILVREVVHAGAHVPAATKLLKCRRPVTRLTIAPSRGNEGFAVIFSMSHTVGNGSTYFSLLKMLSAGGKPFPLNITRKQDLSDKGPDLIGRREHASHLSMPTILNGLGAFMKMKCCRRKPKLFCFNIDEKLLSTAILDAKAMPGAPAKISMNDVLTSGYGRLVKPRLLTMAVDYHGKIEGLSESDAGNYHSGVLYDPNGYATPGAIRESLTSPPPLSRAALPCCCKAIGCRRATITNWASMMRDDFIIPDCTQTLNVPLVDVSNIPVNVAIVFKSGPGKVAMMLFAKSVGMNEVNATLPVGEPVSEKMFPVSGRYQRPGKNRNSVLPF